MSDMDSYFGWMDNAPLRLGTGPSSLSDAEGDGLELDPELDVEWREPIINRRDRRPEGDLRFGGIGGGRKLTADGLGLAGGWRDIVSASIDRGTRHVGQRPSEQVADNHCHRVSTSIPKMMIPKLTSDRC